MVHYCMPVKPWSMVVLFFSSISGSVTHSKDITSFETKYRGDAWYSFSITHEAKFWMMFPVFFLSLIRFAVVALFTNSPGNRPLTDSCSGSKYTSRYAASHGHGEMIHTPCAWPWTWKAQAGLSSSVSLGGWRTQKRWHKVALFRTATSHTLNPPGPLSPSVNKSLCNVGPVLLLFSCDRSTETGFEPCCFLIYSDTRCRGGTMNQQRCDYVSLLSDRELQ